MAENPPLFFVERPASVFPKFRQVGDIVQKSQAVAAELDLRTVLMIATIRADALQCSEGADGRGEANLGLDGANAGGHH